MNIQTRTAPETASTVFHIFSIALIGLFSLGALVHLVAQLA